MAASSCSGVSCSSAPSVSSSACRWVTLPPIELNSASVRFSQRPIAVPPSATNRLMASLASRRVRGLICTMPGPDWTTGYARYAS